MNTEHQGKAQTFGEFILGVDDATGESPPAIGQSADSSERVIFEAHHPLVGPFVNPLKQAVNEVEADVPPGHKVSSMQVRARAEMPPDHVENPNHTLMPEKSGADNLAMNAYLSGHPGLDAKCWYHELV